MPMTRLSVNVNKLATLRNSREKNLPDVTRMARQILAYGAHGITVHPRPDGRHIRHADVFSLAEMIAGWNSSQPPVEFNIEGYPAPEFLQLLTEIRPNQATLVPDPPEALTSNAGWDLVRSEALLRDVLLRVQTSGARVSLFIDPFRFDDAQGAALKRLKPERIELYTEKFSDSFHTPQRDSVTAEYARVAQFADNLGIGVNAGHDLNQENLRYLVEKISLLDEVSIGHALICEALEQGLETTVRNYLRLLGH
ncbi:MAG: pyridoxine 5'-phosphate synthase [Bdellovibrionales bacterium]|nr:pyridoxine 5'-phosphate synthase [Bdellovibrionales bacterium]